MLETDTTEQAAAGEDTRSCTCHPDDRPPFCQRKFALTHCQAHYAAFGLNEIALSLRYWMDWNKNDRDREGLTTDETTGIMVVPPTWPTHGQLRTWAETMELARSILREKF